MTTAVMNYTVNPIWKFFKSVGSSILYALEVQGYARAAAELARQGYYEESREIMMKLKELKR